MKCCASEEDLALYAGGDLESAEVSDHIRSCEDCRRILAEFALAGQILAEGFAEPAEADLGLVRLEVFARVRGCGGISWKRAGAVAAGLVLAGLVWWGRDVRTTEQGRLPLDGSDNSAQADGCHWGGEGCGIRVSPHFSPVVQKRRVRKAGIRRVVFRTDETGRAELKMETADPNVVIVLAMDGGNHAN